MTIKKKIRLSNILMVLIPIGVTALVFGICMQTFLGDYWHSLEVMYRDEKGIQSAQSLIYTYQRELWEINWGDEVPTQAGEPIRQNEEMLHMEKKLSAMGYHIMVKKNDNVVYTNIPEEELRAAAAVTGEILWSASTMTVSAEDISIVKNTFAHGGKEFAVIAVNSQPGEQKVESYFQAYILRYVGIIVLVFFLMTIFVNMILSRWISRSVLVPLEKLREGTRKIRDGNLDTEMDYRRDDEFGQVCRDFDEMREHLKQSVEQRIQDEKRRREMISGISHDLRTPLTSISGYLDGLLEGIADTGEKQLRYLRAMKIRTEDLKRLVDSLSEYNRLESRGLQCRLEPGDLRLFLEEYAAGCREEADRNQVEIRLELEETPCVVAMDQYELRRVFDNLLTNTVRYRESSRSLVVIEETKEEKERQARVVCRDDGPGVPEESLDRIFETFYRLDSARSRSGEGSGIGLAIVKEIIEAHGGTVRAENRGGLAIIILLPLAEGQAETASSPSDGDVSGAPSGEVHSRE